LQKNTQQLSVIKAPFSIDRSVKNKEQGTIAPCSLYSYMSDIIPYEPDDLDEFAKSRFCSLRERFGRSRIVQLKTKNSPPSLMLRRVKQFVFLTLSRSSGFLPKCSMSFTKATFCEFINIAEDKNGPWGDWGFQGPKKGGSHDGESSYRAGRKPLRATRPGLFFVRRAFLQGLSGEEQSG
jgi:hypothetical protein